MSAPARRPDLLTRSEAAAYLGVAPYWLKHNTPAKGGPARVLIPAWPDSPVTAEREDRDLYREADLFAWTERCMPNGFGHNATAWSGFDVYVIRATSTPATYKIGIALDPQRRMRELQTGNPYRLELAYVLSGGGFAVEQRLHRRLDATRLHGEWFAESPELHAMVAWFLERGW